MKILQIFVWGLVLTHTVSEDKENIGHILDVIRIRVSESRKFSKDFLTLQMRLFFPQFGSYVCK